MEWVDATVRANFTMLPERESGWQSSVGSGLRPNHNFLGPGNRDMCMGEVEVVGGGRIRPGETGEVIVSFLLLPEFKKLLKPGFEWRIQAGGQHFANGKVVEVLAS